MCGQNHITIYDKWSLYAVGGGEIRCLCRLSLSLFLSLVLSLSVCPSRLFQDVLNVDYFPKLLLLDIISTCMINSCVFRSIL